MSKTGHNFPGDWEGSAPPGAFGYVMAAVQKWIMESIL